MPESVCKSKSMINLFELLQSGRLSGSDIATALQISPEKAADIIRQCRISGFTETERVGNLVMNRITMEGLQVLTARAKFEDKAGFLGRELIRRCIVLFASIMVIFASVLHAVQLTEEDYYYKMFSECASVISVVIFIFMVYRVVDICSVIRREPTPDYCRIS